MTAARAAIIARMWAAIATAVGAVAGAFKSAKETKQVEARARQATASERAQIEVERLRGENELALRTTDVNARLDMENARQDRKSPFVEVCIVLMLINFGLCGIFDDYRYGFIQTLNEVPEIYTLSLLALIFMKAGGRGVFLAIIRLIPAGFKARAVSQDTRPPLALPPHRYDPTPFPEKKVAQVRFTGDKNYAPEQYNSLTDEIIPAGSSEPAVRGSDVARHPAGSVEPVSSDASQGASTRSGAGAAASAPTTSMGGAETLTAAPPADTDDTRVQYAPPMRSK